MVYRFVNHDLIHTLFFYNNLVTQTRIFPFTEFTVTQSKKYIVFYGQQQDYEIISYLRGKQKLSSAIPFLNFLTLSGLSHVYSRFHRIFIRSAIQQIKKCEIIY